MSPSQNGRGGAPGTRRRLVAEQRAAGRGNSRAGRGNGTGAGKGAGRGGRGGNGGRRRREGSPRRRRTLLGRLLYPLRFAVWLIWALAWRAAAAVAVIFAGAVFYFYATLPEVSDLYDGRQGGSVTMLDRNGEVFAWRGEQFGGINDIDAVSPHLINAVVATEDRRFFRHLGVSIRGTVRAMVVNMRENGNPFSGQGGSTITQQVAKLLCLGRQYDASQWETLAAYEADCRRTTLWRKITELPYAIAMELRYTKEDILSVYLNRAYLGAGAQGFEAASRRYFGVGADAVDPPQAAMLAGLLIAPSYYAPTRNLERAQDRAAVVVGLMQQEGYLTPSQAEAARAEPATLFEAAREDRGGYFADWIMREGPGFLTRDTTEDVIIRTTFDQQIQTAAEAALADVFADLVREGSEAQAAVVVMSADGAVRAMVGGRETQGAGLFNRATQAMRQTGSAFKPFVYATALELGWRFDDTILDDALTIDVPGSGPYSPANYTGNFYGEVTLTEALARSLNTAAVRLSEQVGRDLVRSVASEFGIDSDLADGPALALGASESTLIEMTGAYAGILNGGSAVDPYGMVEIRLAGDDAALIGQEGGMQERVIGQDAARQLTYMMSRVVAEGTGTRARLPDRPAAGKSGTTQAARDAWFVGFTADYVAGVWMGYDDNTPLTGVTGGGLPAEIWHEVMARVHRGLPPRELPMIDPRAAGRVDPPGAPGGPGAAPGPPAGADGDGDGLPRGTLLGTVPQQDARNDGGPAGQDRQPDTAEQILMDVLGTIGGRD